MFLRVLCVLFAVTAWAIPGKTNQKATCGVLEGSIVGVVSRKPLAGAAVVLCKVIQGETCVFRAELSALAKPDGSFRVEQIPLGDYFVFYDPTGTTRETWKDIDGKEMILDLAGLGGIRPAARKDLVRTFGCGGGITVKKGTVFQFSNGRVVGSDGSVVSEKCGLTLDFHAGQLLRVKVQGNVSSVAINAWDL